MCYIKWYFSSNFILLGASVSNLTTMFPISHVLFLVWNDPLLLCQSRNLSLQKPQLVRIMSYNNTDKSSNEAWYYFKIDITILQDFNINFTVVSGFIWIFVSIVIWKCYWRIIQWLLCHMYEKLPLCYWQLWIMQTLIVHWTKLFCINIVWQKNKASKAMLIILWLS